MITPLPDVGSSRLWLIDLDAPAGAVAAELSADEARRAARFVFPEDRHRYVQAHAALRHLLATALSVAPADLAFGEGDAGKPFLLHHPGVHFNLSHSGHLGLVGIDTRSEIGVDIEWTRPIPDGRALAQQHFDAAELSSMEDDTDPDAFLRGWTRKEACVKALGTGLHRDLRRLGTGCEAGPRVLWVDGTSVTVRSLPGTGGFVASIASVARVAQRGSAGDRRG